MKKFFSFILFAFVVVMTVSAQNSYFKVNSVEANTLPNGEIKEMLTWRDISGEHLLVLCEKEYPEDIELGRHAELAAHHYIMRDDKFVQTWRTYDFMKECSVDIMVNFIPNSVCITDLDGDGESEVWIVYLLGCKGDVSPWGMKVIMHEGTQNYAMRGEQYCPYVDEGGKYKFDANFEKAPESFRAFAIKYWNKYVKYNVM